MTTRFYGWKLLAAFWVILSINLAFPAYGSSVINAYMVTDLNLDRTTLGWIVSIYMLMSGLPGPLVAVSVNRFGVRVTLILGSLLLLTGSLLMALIVNDGLSAIMVYGLLIGAGVLTGGPLAAQTGVAFWFVKRRAMAMAIILCAAGIGGTIAAPLLDWIIAGAGGNWRLGWWLIAGLTCVTAAVAALFVREKPADLGQLPDGGAAADAGEQSGPKKTGKVFITTEEWSFAEVLRSPVLWMMMLCGVGVSAGFTLFMAHGIVHLKDLGHTPAIAAVSISAMLVSNLIGKLIFGALGDRIEPRYIWVVTIVVFSLGMYLLVDADTVMELYAFAICLGFGFGTGVVCMMTVLCNYFGTRPYASVIGLAMAIQTTFSAIAPPLAGHLFDTSGSYAVSFYSVAGLCFAGAVILLFIPPPRKSLPTEAIAAGK